MQTEPQKSTFDERTAGIIALRESGAIYREIGARFGVSGERVRQILRVVRPDLCHRRIAVARRASAKARIVQPCVVCARPIRARAGEVRKCCSPACSGRLKRTRERTAPIYLRLRREGLSWREIGARFGQSWAGPYFAVRRWAADTGRDIGWALRRRRADAVRSAEASR